MLDKAVATRLAKLLRMLTSSHHGEILAAVGKINGLIAAYEVDWDDLFAKAGIDLTKEQMQRLYDAGYQKGLEDAAKAAPPSADDWAAAGTSRTDEVGHNHANVCAILEAAGRANLKNRLSDFERSFSISMAERLEDWGTRAFVSEKQWAVLDRLRTKLQREGFL